MLLGVVMRAYPESFRGYCHPNVMDDLILPKGRYPDSFVLIYFKVCQELGVLYEGIWRMLRVPDQRLGGQGHPGCHG